MLPIGVVEDLRRADEIIAVGCGGFEGFQPLHDLDDIKRKKGNPADCARKRNSKQHSQNMGKTHCLPRSYPALEPAFDGIKSGL